jgi:hypothetical protein
MLRFEQWENVKFLQKLDKSFSKTFQMINKCTAKKPWAVVPCDTNVLQERDSLEDTEHTGQPRMVRIKLKIQEVATLVRANCSQTVDEIAAAGISHGTCHNILSDDLNMSHVTQHSSMCPDARPT